MTGIDSRLGAGLIRVALALRADPRAELDPIAERTAREMELDLRVFRRYLAENIDTLWRTQSPEKALAVARRRRRDER